MRNELIKCAEELDSIIASLEAIQEPEMPKVSQEQMGFGTVSKADVAKTNPLMDFIFS